MTMRAVRLGTPEGPAGLRLERIDVREPAAGEALVRVHAAALTRDELEWPEDRLPATPSYELSGVVTEVADDAGRVHEGEAVFALTPFDRDGVAAEFALVPTGVIARKPEQLDHLHAAAVPMAALSAWQGLVVHGGLEEGMRVLVHGAAGGVGHVAVQLAVHRGAQVIGTTTSEDGAAIAREMGATEVISSEAFAEGRVDPVDLVFDTVGDGAIAHALAIVGDGGSVVSINEEPDDGVDATFFVVDPDGQQLEEIAELVDRGAIRPSIDSAYPLERFRDAFDRAYARGKRGKVVLRIVDD